MFSVHGIRRFGVRSFGVWGLGIKVYGLWGFSGLGLRRRSLGKALHRPE